jgi:hypothetical protein
MKRLSGRTLDLYPRNRLSQLGNTRRVKQPSVDYKEAQGFQMLQIFNANIADSIVKEDQLLQRRKTPQFSQVGISHSASNEIEIFQMLQSRNLIKVRISHPFPQQMQRGKLRRFSQECQIRFLDL